jgi:hypothetical protein
MSLVIESNRLIVVFLLVGTSSKLMADAAGL